MTSSCLFLLFSILPFFLNPLRASACEEHGNLPTSFTIINSLPKNSKPMQVGCSARNSSTGLHSLGVGEEFRVTIKERSVYFCRAMIDSRMIASWHAFQPRRDVSHEAVYWLAKKEGFFLSWDKSTWVRKAVWETE